MELMRNIASVGGEAVSASVRITATAQGELVEATIDGKPIDPDRTYTIATIDYLAAGNDKMVALKNKVKMTDTKMLLRDVMMEYIIKSRVIDAQLEGRITVK
ncbi:MAG: 5'-nucleotidase C-terminal domain-containing protein [Bacteroidaceae bacterium]|nr:5'-nucleotidase C-terminal domain-containing protein [Bacteroidaceae bacterium]